MLTLTLKAASNPDYPGRYLPKACKVQVATFTEARTAFERWRDSNDLGGGNMHRDAGLLQAGKVILGRFSYNARFWPSSDLRIDQISAFNLPAPSLAIGA